MTYNEMDGNVTSPKGFLAAGGHCGVKKDRPDLALIVSEAPCAAAGCFTQNVVKAAPVLWDMETLDGGKPVRGIVVNSGNANACTGEQGLRDARAMAEALAKAATGRPYEISTEEILVCSTGVIGVPLPIEKITNGIASLYQQIGGAAAHGQSAAEAIRTTDTFAKTAAVTLDMGGQIVTIGGMAKGSGMIHPNMATLLSFITTDAAIEQAALRKALTDSTRDTYNMISVDGDSSTNDTVLTLANGLAGNAPIAAGTADYDAFKSALDCVNRKLAMAIARDGEGATKLVAVRVTGARSDEDARKIARAVVSSNLFKAALFGADANWGRALCAMGYSGGLFDPAKVSLWFGRNEELPVMRDGEPVAFDETAAKALLSQKEVYVDIRLYEGDCAATAWGCDLTYDYVKINGDYRS